jgi:hypothetical protein
MSELRKTLEEEVRKIIDEPMPELSPSKPPEIETEGVFDPSLLDSAGHSLPPESDPFTEDPLARFADRLVGGMERMAVNHAPMIFEPPPTEHKVRIYLLDRAGDLQAIEREIESYLNNGYRGFPTVCNDFLIMDFARRKESEEK